MALPTPKPVVERAARVALEGVFGSLAAPIVLMLRLYVSAVALLVGAELSAEVERMWPSSDAGLKATPQPRSVARAPESTA